MSFFVVLQSEKIGLVGGKAVHNEFERHVDSFNNSSMPKLDNEKILLVQADGDELDYIVEHFKGIPLVMRPVPDSVKNKPRPFLYKKVVVWYGDWANFIYFNLR